MGTGRLETILSDEFEFLGVDIASNCRDADCPIPLVVAGLWEDLDIGTFDAVICTDVLEHIPEKLLPKVIDNLGVIAPHGYITIGLSEEKLKFKDLPLHMTIHDAEWWDERIPFAEVTTSLGGVGVARY